MLRKGRYRHYKGQYYEVVDTAKHSETEELMVVYRALYGEFDLWVRPLVMFSETLDNGSKRFEYCGDENGQRD